MSTSLAVDYIWMGGSSSSIANSGTWWQNGNWSVAGAPNSVNDRAIFNEYPAGGGATNTHPTNPVLQEIIFNTTSGWMIGNNERDITLNAPGTGIARFTQNNSGVVDLNIDLILADDTIIGGTGTGDVNLFGSLLSGAAQRTGITGAGKLTKEGSFTFTVSAPIQHTGGTDINGGTFVLNESGHPVGTLTGLGQFRTANTINVTDATLRANQNGVFGAGQAHQINLTNSTLDFAAGEGYQSRISLDNSTITTHSTGLAWRVGYSGPALIEVDNTGATTSAISGVLALVGNGSSPTLTFDVADGSAPIDLTVSSTISDHPGFEGAMTVVKTGTGTMALTGTSTFGGGVDISQGTVRVGSTAALGTGTVTLGDAGTGTNDVQLTLAANNINNAIVVSNNGTGTATILGDSQYNSHVGSITLNRDTIFAIPGSGAGTDWWFGFGAGGINGNGTAIIQGGDGGTTALTGGNRVVFGGNNSYSGGTVIESGKLQLGGVNSAGTGDVTLGNANTGTAVTQLRVGANINNDIVVSSTAPGSDASIASYNGLQTLGGGLQVDRDVTLFGASDRLSWSGANAVWSGSGDITIQGGRVTHQGTANTWTGDMTINAGSIFQSGHAQTLTAANSVNADGTLQLNNVDQTINGLSGSGTVRNIVGGNQLTVGAGGASATYSGVIVNGSGPLDLLKAGNGEQTLTGVGSSYNALMVQRAAGAADSSTLTLAGSGTTTVNYVGLGDPANSGGLAGNAVLNVQDTHDLNINGNLQLGEFAGANSTLNQTGGSVDVSGEIRIAHYPGGTNSTYDISAGVLNSTGDVSVGWDGVGAMNVSGTADVNANATTRVQRNSTLTLSDDATFDTDFLSVGDSRGAGSVVQDGGTMNATGANGVRIGHWPAGAGSTYDISGGTLNTTALTAGWDGLGDLTVSGEAVINTDQLQVGRNANGTVSQIGGTVNVNSLDATIGGSNGGSLGGDATYTQSGGSHTVERNMLVGTNVGAGVYNLQGGTLGFNDVNDLQTNVPAAGAGAPLESSLIIDSEATSGSGAFSMTGGVLERLRHINPTGRSDNTFTQLGGTITVGADVLDDGLGGTPFASSSDPGLTGVERFVTVIGNSNDNWMETGIANYVAGSSTTAATLEVDIFGSDAIGTGEGFLNTASGTTNPFTLLTDSDLLVVEGTADLHNLIVEADWLFSPYENPLQFYDVLYATEGFVGEPNITLAGDATMFRIVDDGMGGQFLQVAAPEPSTIVIWTLIGTTLFGGAAWRRRRRKSAA